MGKTPLKLEKPPLAVVKRFVSRLQPAGLNGGCWAFMGHHNIHERPQFKIKGKAQWAYRVAMAIFQGEAPEGMEVHHTCNHPWCVNPDHLQPISPDQHVRKENHGRRRAEEVPF